MICPRCQYEFDDPSHAAVKCPDCGLRLIRSVAGVIKTSAVLISARGQRGFYGSVQEVPEPLRTELLEVTAGSNAGTIVIADKAGRERLEFGRAAADQAACDAPRAPAPVPPPTFLGYSWVLWAGVCLALGAASVITALFSTRW